MGVAVKWLVVSICALVSKEDKCYQGQLILGCMFQSLVREVLFVCDIQTTVSRYVRTLTRAHTHTLSLLAQREGRKEIKMINRIDMKIERFIKLM